MLAYKEGQTVRLVSRRGTDVTRRFPNTVAALRKLDPSRPILAGEVAIYDGQLLSRLEWRRHHAHDELATPPV